MAHQAPRTTTLLSEVRPATPRPLFLYGTLCCLPLLALILTGDANNISAVTILTQPARVNRYARFVVQNCDDAAAVKHPRSYVEGYLLNVETDSQRAKLNEFEGDSWKPISIMAITNFQPDPEMPWVLVEADMYIWTGDINKITSVPWSAEVFERNKLKDWLDTFQGVEFIDPDQKETTEDWTIVEKA